MTMEAGCAFTCDIDTSCFHFEQVFTLRSAFKVTTIKKNQTLTFFQMILYPFQMIHLNLAYLNSSNWKEFSNFVFKILQNISIFFFGQVLSFVANRTERSVYSGPWANRGKAEAQSPTSNCLYQCTIVLHCHKENGQFSMKAGNTRVIQPCKLIWRANVSGLTHLPTLFPLKMIKQHRTKSLKTSQMDN